MDVDNRRRALRSAARFAVAAALGALVVKLGFRRRTKSTGYCPHAGRCGDCAITARCDVFQAIRPKQGARR